MPSVVLNSIINQFFKRIWKKVDVPHKVAPVYESMAMFVCSIVTQLSYCYIWSQLRSRFCVTFIGEERLLFFRPWQQINDFMIERHFHFLGSAHWNRDTRWPLRQIGRFCLILFNTHLLLYLCRTNTQMKWTKRE